jgi:prepilin-type processing-associated H-X9-DG protein
MTEGGNENHPLKQNLYVQFAAISNFLATPKPLADPADMRRALQPAWHWGTTQGGLWNPGFQNNSVSYFLGLHGDMRMPREVLAGDRNLFASGFVSSCSSGLSPVTVLERDAARWTNDVHGLTGNVLFFDGSVKQVDSLGFREAIFTGPANDNVAGANGSQTHILAHTY